MEEGGPPEQIGDEEVTPEEVGRLLDSIKSGLAKEFQRKHLQSLAKAAYDSADTIRAATLEHLQSAGLPQAKAQLIINSCNSGSIALDTYYQMLDPQNRTESSVASDRSSCFTYYSANQKGKVRCSVLGANFDRQCIRAAHIMQRRWLGRAGTPAYKSLTDALGINSHNDVRNMLPMHLGVETLFDLGFICFRQVDNNDELLYEINVLNDKDPLMQLSLDQLATQKLASHEKHFGTQQRMLRLSSGSPKHTGRLKGKELDGMSFRVQAGDAPSKRCIAIHALLCIRLAERKGWINRGIMDIEEAAWLSPGCTKEKRQQLLSWIPDAL